MQTVEAKLESGMSAKGKRYVFDLDGTICAKADNLDRNYQTCEPLIDRIAKVNELQASGNHITLFTSRGMGRSGGDVRKSKAKHFELTKKQLAKWGVNYDALTFGKPSADVYVDDRAQSATDFFALEIAKEKTETFDVTANREAEELAATLIREGKTVLEGEWSGPSAERENAYIEANGWDAYAKWFLGRKSEVEPETKGHYNFPFSDDFEKVHRRGLIAIRSRAAQFDDKSVYDAAGRLLELYETEEDEEYQARYLRISFQRKKLKKRGTNQVNKQSGMMTNVALIQLGEAKGHGMWIDQGSLDSAMEVIGENLPAYVTHEGAVEADRILKEIGVFSGFFVESGKLKAETFRALDSFQGDEPERFRRLFDLAEAMPDAFGLSLVFEANLVWIDSDGTEVPISEGRPEDALRDLPSVRFGSIKSADFVDAPAANESGLFSENQKQGNLKMDEQIESTEVEEKTEEPATEKVETPEVEALEASEEVDGEASAEVDDLASLQTKVEELTAQLAEQAAKIAELTDSLNAAETKNEKLSALVEGEEALSEGDGNPKGPSLIERFQAATGAEQTILWKQNKLEILRSARG